MRPIKASLLLPIYFVLLYCPSYGDTIDIQLTFDPEEAILDTEMGYDTVDYPDTIHMDDFGKPSLPKTSAYVSLPFNSTVSSVSIVSSQTQDISGNFFIYPAQVPEYTDEYSTGSKFVLPDPSVYNEDAFYPENPYSDPHICNFVGATMGAVEVYPFRFNPVDRDLEIYTSLTLRLTYTPPSPPPTAERYMEDRNRDLIIDGVKSMVKNPDDVDDNYEPVNIFTFSESNPSGYSLDAPDMNDNTSEPSDMTYPYTYVIITNDKYCGNIETDETDGIPTECAPLKQWRTELGVPATMRTVEWIAEEYWTEPTEHDLQEAIRDFLTNAEEKWGTMWFIIIGDVDMYKGYVVRQPDYKYSEGYSAIVPARYLLSEKNHRPQPGVVDQFYAPCDLYYMNVTDDFNLDGDNFYGDWEDIHDPDFTFAIDIFGGRVPADTETEVETFVDKLLDYEQCNFIFPSPPTPTYLSHGLQIAADFGIDGDDLEEKIGEECLSPLFNIENIIEKKRGSEIDDGERYPDYPEPWEVVKEMHDNPAGIINFATHGHPRGYYILSHKKHKATIQFLATTHEYPCQFNHGWNFDKTLNDVELEDNTYSFLYSHSCSIHRYDDAITGVVGEEFLFNSSWGGPISVGNIRLGKGGPSYNIMADFYNFLLNQTSDYSDDDCYSGKIQCETLQIYWQGDSTDVNMTYINNLFGCPRTAIWRGDPQTFDEPTIDFDNGTLTITVEDDEDPVESATVCLWMKFDIPNQYFLEETDENGDVEFDIGIGGCINAKLTISYEQYNYKPYQTNVTEN